MYRIFLSYDDWLPLVFPSDIPSICALWNVLAATIIPFVGRCAVLKWHTIYHRSYCQLVHQSKLSTSTVSLEFRTHTFLRRMASHGVKRWMVTWRKCDGRVLVYVQGMAVLLLESRPGLTGLHESLLFATAASWGAFSHSPIHWERLSLWEATKSLLQTPPQLPLQWMQGRSRA